MRQLTIIPFLVSLMFFLIHCAGTETGNPNVIVDTDFSKATTFLSNSGAKSYDSISEKIFVRLREKLLGARPITIHSQFQQSDDFSKDPLLKLTEQGTIESAIRMKYTANLPVAIQMNKVGNKYYVLFDRPVDQNGALCTLLEFTLEGEITCIDSSDRPAEQRKADPRQTIEEDRKYFMVTDQGPDLVYRDQGGSLVVRESNSGERKVFGPDSWTFEKTFKGSDGSIFGANCRNFSSPTDHALFLSCKVTSSEVEVYSVDDYGKPSKKIFKLRGDRLLVVADVNVEPGERTDYDNNLHMRIGPLGQFMNLTNYSTDVSALGAFSVDATDQYIRKYMTSLVELPLPLGGHIFFASEWPNGEFPVCFPILRNSSLGYGLQCSGNAGLGGPTSFPVFLALDYHGSRRAVLAWGGDQQSCEVVRSLGVEGIPSPPAIPNHEILIRCDDINATPTMIRFISEDEFIFGGPKKGTELNLSKYYYYKYNLTTRANKLLFESTSPFSIFPLL